MSYGRIGAVGRTKTRSFTRIEDAAAAIDASLSRSATLPRGPGVAYRLHRVDFEAPWANAGLSERLASLQMLRPAAHRLAITSLVNLKANPLPATRIIVTSHKKRSASLVCTRKAKMSLLSQVEMDPFPSTCAKWHPGSRIPHVNPLGRLLSRLTVVGIPNAERPTLAKPFVRPQPLHPPPPFPGARRTTNPT
jgi:hypothetical protein